MVRMTFGQEPERVGDFGLPEQTRVLLWLTTKAVGPLREAAEAGMRLDVSSDRDRLAVTLVGAVLRELVDQGNTLRLLPPPAEASEASDIALDKLVQDLLRPPDDPDPQEDLYGALVTWFKFLEGHLGEMSDRGKMMLGFAYGVGTTAAENEDRVVARHYLGELRKEAERWRADPAWPGRSDAASPDDAPSGTDA
jgi:hypothetical protein